DILIIDEALSVGDKAFAEKSFQKMEDFKKEGKTMIFVSHSLRQMKNFCQKILWLEYGQVKAYGEVDEVIPKYEALLENWQRINNILRKVEKKEKTGKKKIQRCSYFKSTNFASWRNKRKYYKYR